MKGIVEQLFKFDCVHAHKHYESAVFPTAGGKNSLKRHLKYGKMLKSLQCNTEECLKVFQQLFSPQVSWTDE